MLGRARKSATQLSSGVRQEKMKDGIRKSISTVSIIFSAIIFVFVVLSSSRYIESGEWRTITAPVIATFVTAILGVVIIHKPKEESSVFRYVTWGAFIGAFGTMILIANNLFRRYDLISNDGTAYWGLLIIPSIYFGIPAFAMGGLMGLSAHYIVKARKVKNLPNKSL